MTDAEVRSEIRSGEIVFGIGHTLRDIHRLGRKVRRLAGAPVIHGVRRVYLEHYSFEIWSCLRSSCKHGTIHVLRSQRQAAKRAGGQQK